MGLGVVGGLFVFEDRVGSNGKLEALLQGRRSGFGHLLDIGERYRYQKRQPSEGRDSTRVADIYRISALSKQQDLFAISKNDLCQPVRNFLDASPRLCSTTIR